MAKNIVIACDGTNNEFGKQTTNVVRLIESLDRDPSAQLLYYDPGVGTLPEPDWQSKAGQTLSLLAGLAFGTGLDWKMTEAYRFLMERWRPGDRVYLFGFSRGAYTVRVLAAFLHLFGLLPTGNDNLLPYTMRLFRAARKALKDPAKSKSFWGLCDGYRETFAREIPGQTGNRFPIHFVGVWDTVSSVGWVWDPETFPFTARNPGILKIRHAVSIDERRCFFRQNCIGHVEGQDSTELWFPGVHCDVGGGYPDAEGGLWQEPFRWMLEEASAAGLRLDSRRAECVWANAPPTRTAWAEPQHESLKGAWWLAEYFPKLSYRPSCNCRLPDLGRGRRRKIPDTAVPHASTLRRLRSPAVAYHPPNIPAAWLALPDPPEAA